MKLEQSLDRYLTIPPDDGFDNWADEVLELLSTQFHEENELWIFGNNGQHNEWLQKLYYTKECSPIIAAKIIERAFSLYLNSQ